jgi:hypothetical protein
MGGNSYLPLYQFSSFFIPVLATLLVHAKRLRIFTIKDAYAAILFIS